MNKKNMLILFLLISPLVLYGFYVVSVLMYGSLTDFKPKEVISLKENKSKSLELSDTTVSFLSWNIGYASLGYKADFFLDGGSMIRSPKHDVEKYLTGIKNFIEKEKDIDFILLQEIDKKSKRSYFTNEYQKISDILDYHSNVFAENFKVNFIPVPLTSTSPLGSVLSGLANFSKFKTTDNTRYQFPGQYEWPKRIFFLDRCFLVSRTPVKYGKELVVINSHNSAYDEGGVLKAQEMAYLKVFLQTEYSKGNYVVVGSDWNQCPPNFPYDSFSKENSEDYFQSNIEEDYLPAGWQWVFDTKTPTNRKLSKAYVKDKTFTTLIDFYLVSPNVEVVSVETIDLDFQFSDHQPIKLKVKLK